MKKFGDLLKNISLILPSVLLFNCLQAEALQVVYPKNINTQVSAESTFFVGNTEPGSSLTINDKVVKVYDNGSFVEVVPLMDGDNTVKIESAKNDAKDTVTYIIKKVPKTNLVCPEPQTEDFPENEYIYASIVKDNTPLREKPDENAKRITHLNHGTILMLNGKSKTQAGGGYYRVSLSPVKNAWVKSENIVNYSTINGKMLANASDVNLSEDKLYNYIKTGLSFKVPYKITETDTGLTLELYNIKENSADTVLFKPAGAVKSLAVNTVSQENTSTYYIELNNKLWGYNAFYDGNTLVLKIRKAPQIDVKTPLKGITIALDPGHGGNDAGAIGPTGVKEKDINLDVSKRLKTSLEKAGANVVMTRTDDSDTDLYDRSKKAQDGDALIMLSIHANALADGADPYTKHGTSTFYYNKESLELAKTVRDVMVKDLGTKDDGVSRCSFAVTRPTMPLSVLIETAYMIHPDEYTLLLDENFRQKAAESIQHALEIYLLNSVKQF